VTKQNIVFDMPVTLCPTSDNIFIDIHVSVVFDIQPEHEYVYQLCMNINELNQMLEAAITERVRNMGRSVSSKHVYSLRGEKHAEQMRTHLKQVMSTKGINIKSVIITNVKLPPDVANALQEKTIFQFKNTLERKKQAFELRTLNDKEELELLRQIRLQERQYEIERAELDQATKIKEIEKIKANSKRLQAEMKEKTLALTNQINAETEVKYNEILAEANIIETEILANAKASAARLKAEADAYEMRTITECERENAETIA
jgi:regulator of protease activity HflC (stomatin/prohibitin superfamily)